jgi:hypothetical protein
VGPAVCPAGHVSRTIAGLGRIWPDCDAECCPGRPGAIHGPDLKIITDGVIFEIRRQRRRDERES